MKLQLMAMGGVMVEPVNTLTYTHLDTHAQTHTRAYVLARALTPQ